MQRCRGYYTRARALALKTSTEGQKAGGKVRLSPCLVCLQSPCMGRSLGSFSRSFVTSSPALVMNVVNAINEVTSNKMESNAQKAASENLQKDVDFFGIEGGEGVVDVSGPEPSLVNADETFKKYDFLFQNRPRKSEEKIYETSFGSLRFDADNVVRRKRDRSYVNSLDALMMWPGKMANSQQTTLAGDTHFQSHENASKNQRPNSELLYESPVIGMAEYLRTKRSSNLVEEQYDQHQASTQGVLEEQYFGTETDVRDSQSPKSHVWLGTEACDETNSDHPPVVQPNYFEEQYFDTAHENPCRNQWHNSELPHRMADFCSSNFIEEQYDQHQTATQGVHKERYFETETVTRDSQSPNSRIWLGTKARDEAASVHPQGVQPNYFEEQYFGTVHENGTGNQSLSSELLQESPVIGTAAFQRSKISSSVIEEQYFGPDKHEVELPDAEKLNLDYSPKVRSQNPVEEQCFVSEKCGSENLNDWVACSFPQVRENPVEDCKKTSARSRFDDLSATSNSTRPPQSEKQGSKNKPADHSLGSKGGDRNTVANEKEEEEVIHCGLRKPNAGERIFPDVENPKTAYDYAMRLRQERRTRSSSTSTAKGSSSTDAEEDFVHVTEGDRLPDQKVDSFGFRLYNNQVLDLDQEPESIVLKMLKDSALYNENDILALSKPYGLPVHHGDGHRHFLTKFLPDLAKHFCVGYDNPQLYTVHRLDKETTGVLLLAKTQEMAKRLNKMFANGEIKKTYWALTKGTPAPLEGIIDIPIGEALIGGKLRMVLKPPYSSKMKPIAKKSSSGSSKAVTQFKVLSCNGNAALVELMPSTGVKHQLRVHLASALACPVLGDHKYSHLTRFAPQTLPSDMLQNLGMRQSKVRTLSMHLHARGVIIPEMVDGRNIIIGARLPKHFKVNMQKLKIKHQN